MGITGIDWMVKLPVFGTYVATADDATNGTTYVVTAGDVISYIVF